MSTGPVSSSPVVMFDRAAEHTFSNSSFAAVGRDHISLNINLATGGTHSPYPPASEGHPGQESVSDPLLPRVQNPSSSHPSLLSRVCRVIRPRSMRRPRNMRTPQTTASNSRLPAPVAQQSHVIPSPPPPSPTSSFTFLPDGSSISSLDSSCQSRSYASSEEEVYERSLLSKGQGLPLFKPQPLGKAARIGDFGILGQDGFEAFGNIYDTNDQREFLLQAPEEHCITHQPETLSEGQVLSTGIEEGARMAAADSNVTSNFVFHCRENQGAVLAVTSPGALDTLTRKGRNDLRHYLCRHGPPLVSRLHRERYLEAGQSLYVVTGTIKSNSWGIAVHTSPMREPFNQLVLSRRQGRQRPTYEWTSRGKAYARCGSSISSAVDHAGERAKDQSLFLRGFLITPSSDFGQKDKAEGSSSTGNAGSNSSRETEDRGNEENPSSGGQHERFDSNNGNSFHERSSQFQSLTNECLVEIFPSPTSKSKCYYPSQSLNEVLLEDNDADVAITHDDDWRHSVNEDYLSDEALHTLMRKFWSKNTSTVLDGVATTHPLANGLDTEKTLESTTFHLTTTGTCVTLHSQPSDCEDSGSLENVTSHEDNQGASMGASRIGLPVYMATGGRKRYSNPDDPEVRERLIPLQHAALADHEAAVKMLLARQDVVRYDSGSHTPLTLPTAEGSQQSNDFELWPDPPEPNIYLSGALESIMDLLIRQMIARFPDCYTTNQMFSRINVFHNASAAKLDWWVQRSQQRTATHEPCYTIPIDAIDKLETSRRKSMLFKKLCSSEPTKNDVGVTTSSPDEFSELSTGIRKDEGLPSDEGLSKDLYTNEYLFVPYDHFGPDGNISAHPSRPIETCLVCRTLSLHELDDWRTPTAPPDVPIVWIIQGRSAPWVPHEIAQRIIDLSNPAAVSAARNDLNSVYICFQPPGRARPSSDALESIFLPELGLPTVRVADATLIVDTDCVPHFIVYLEGPSPQERHA